MLFELFDTVIAQGASDLHIAVGRRPHIRVAGNLVDLAQHAPLSQEEVIQILVDLLGKTRAAEVLDHREVDFPYAYTAKSVRFRGTAFIQRGLISIALRTIEKVRSFETLNLPPNLIDFTRKEQGFFLVVGPVGQGKSTTLAAMINAINTERAEHIVTIESPIEYIYEEQNSIIDQREVGIDTASFASGLESAFRQDVNVIMVGEMRDAETIATAVTAAETGHLVFSTLHTNSAAQTVDRIIDSFPAVQQNQIRNQLSNSLLGIFSIRLLPSLRGGRVPAYELLINNDAVSNLIREGRSHEIESVIETHRSEGMISMNQSLASLVGAGQITLDEAIRFSDNPSGLRRLVV